ncbi:helix-turn-helix domain-containing protein [Streptomyces sp. NPDC054784]
MTALTRRPGVGHRIRQARLRTGLSQTELAGADISPSYVSLVEHGKRVPSEDVLRVLSHRLGVPVRDLLEEVEEPEPQAARPTLSLDVRRVDLVSRFVQARKQWENGDPEGALKHFTAVLENDSAAQHQDVLLESRLSVAEILRELGRTSESLESLESLLGNLDAAEKPELWQRVQITTADVLERTGRVGDALRHAHAAYLAAPSGRVSRLRALEAMVRCCYWTGNVSWVADLDPTEGGAQTAFSPLLGSVRLYQALVLREEGRYEEAIEVVAASVARLKPIEDPELWGRTTVLYANMTLLSRGDVAAARESLERARQMMWFVSMTEVPHWLIAADAVCAHTEGRTEAAVELARRVLRDRDDVRAHSLGASLLSAGLVLAESGLAAEARDCRVRAAGLFQQAQAYRYAALAWEQLNSPLGPANRTARPGGT